MIHTIPCVEILSTVLVVSEIDQTTANMSPIQAVKSMLPRGSNPKSEQRRASEHHSQKVAAKLSIAVGSVAAAVALVATVVVVVGPSAAGMCGVATGAATASTGLVVVSTMPVARRVAAASASAAICSLTSTLAALRRFPSSTASIAYREMCK